MPHPVITETDALNAFCDTLKGAPWMALDTEFLREKTYYPKLCLIQVSTPSGEMAAIDPLADGLDLSAFNALMADTSILKIFHSARQDLEIFYHLTGAVPAPLFDTQVAAMVCGFGEAIAYAGLVKAICGATIDKGQRFTDWSRRPLSDKQLDYALDDVKYLPEVYLALSAQLEEKNRSHWIAEEMAILADANTYITHPEEAWQRIRIRTRDRRTLAILREIAAWREQTAQARDVPRGRILTDDAAAELANATPKDAEAMKRLRSLNRPLSKEDSQAVLDAIARGRAVPDDQCPRRENRPPSAPDSASSSLLRVLLSHCCAREGIAPKLVASARDLEVLAACSPEKLPEDLPALHGWRNEVFGKYARDLLNGTLALSLDKGHIALFEWAAS